MDNDWESMRHDMHRMIDDVHDNIRAAEKAMKDVCVERTIDTGEHLIYPIRAKPWKARWRLFRVFFRLSFAILFKGEAKLKVKKTVVTKDPGHGGFGWSSTSSGRMRSDAPNYSAKPTSSKS
jgi:hypothetical protein